MSESASNKKRIYDELVKTGISRYSIRKNEVRQLLNIIHEDEHIGAAINGRSDVGSVMLVATNVRVLFLDCKSFYSTLDELSYDVVSGVNLHTQGIFSSVILHTRIGEYNLRFVNPKRASAFVEFIEAKRLENPDSRTSAIEKIGQPGLINSDVEYIKLDKEQRNFLNTHNSGVLSTIDRAGNVHGATIYYVANSDTVYMLTKSDTEKARNVLVHPQVALTITEELAYQTLQLRGFAEVVNNNDKKNEVFNQILKFRNELDQTTLPPVTKVQNGSYVVLKISFTEAKYYNFKN
ncbi:pyridoxamine 5'-phosphate oxidase family protein [Candidatus Saccharibacteria bacterium]|nr:pyridoxamine 5'-phosphate oxidase family protein [Candidatus Saccharibacteria bacterium]